MVMGMKKKDYALQQGVNIIAVLRNQLATGLVVPITDSVSVVETATLTGKMEQLQASLEAKDIECIQLMEQIEDIQAAKVRGSQSVPKANETSNSMKEAQLVEATGEIARLATKVEELELKAKMLMVYKAEHGIPESAVELKSYKSSWMQM